MSERFIISRELEGIIDKENVFGDEGLNSISIEILLKTFKINSNIKNIKIKKRSVSFMFSIAESDIYNLISHNGPIDLISVGRQQDKFVQFADCNIRSLDITANEDMYICKIIIDRIE